MSCKVGGGWGDGGREWYFAVRGGSKNRVLSVEVDKVDRLCKCEWQRFYGDSSKLAADENVRIIHASECKSVRFALVIGTNRKHVNT